jgi:hypothetical protein
MSDTEGVPASYNEPAPGQYSTEEHLKAQQEQTSAVNGEPLHPELSDDSELTDPAEVGQKPPSPQDSADDADKAGKHDKGSE